MKAKLEIFETADALAEHVAHWLCERAIASTGSFTIALSGGSTPKRAYEKLAVETDYPWDRTHWFFGDERFVGKDDPRSNYRMAHETLLAKAPADHVHPMPTDFSDAALAAAAYEMHLKAFFGPQDKDFDVTLLGLGTDGHTASLFPGDPALEEKAHWVAPARLHSDEPRITLTYPLLNKSRTIAFLVSGTDKRDMLKRLVAGDKEIPAGRLNPAGDLIVFADKAAVS